MTDLTVVILTKNEERNLRKCVESFRGVAKRFVIVDRMRNFRRLVLRWISTSTSGFPMRIS